MENAICVVHKIDSYLGHSGSVPYEVLQVRILPWKLCIWFKELWTSVQFLFISSSLTHKPFRPSHHHGWCHAAGCQAFQGQVGVPGGKQPTPWQDCKYTLSLLSKCLFAFARCLRLSVASASCFLSDTHIPVALIENSRWEGLSCISPLSPSSKQRRTVLTPGSAEWTLDPLGSFPTQSN